MNIKPVQIFVIIAAIFVAAPLGSASALTLSDKTSLQVAMQKHVDRQTIDGAYLYFDQASAKVRTLRPATAHPMIMQMGPYYVLCFDFLDTKGKKVEVDYYMARKGRSWVVFHSAVASRNKLAALVKAGIVRPAK